MDENTQLILATGLVPPCGRMIACGSFASDNPPFMTSQACVYRLCVDKYWVHPRYRVESTVGILRYRYCDSDYDAEAYAAENGIAFAQSYASLCCGIITFPHIIDTRRQRHILRDDQWVNVYRP